jgi:hypothetical protein
LGYPNDNRDPKENAKARGMQQKEKRNGERRKTGRAESQVSIVSLFP